MPRIPHSLLWPGLLVGLGGPCLGAGGAGAKGGAAPRREEGSRYGQRPTPGDSRFPAEHPRPTGALLGPLPAGVALVGETIHLACRYGGAGCAVRQGFVLRQAGEARDATLLVVSAALFLGAEQEGRRLELEPVPPAGPAPAAESTGQAVDPGTRRPYSLPGPRARRPLRTHRLVVALPARGTVTVTLITHSVGGFDRTRWRRTQPEVSFAGTRRKDPFVYHHELRLRHPLARPAPGGERGGIDVTLRVPRGLAIGANVRLTCRRMAAEQECRGRIPATEDWLRYAMSAHRRRPVGFFAGVGVGFTARGAEAHLRAGLSLMLRQRRDLLSLAVETDAHRRASLALVYQVFAPWRPSSQEMGFHGEFGVVLDVHPEPRPALRLGSVFHMGVVAAGLLWDIYPGEFAEGGGPAWRGMLSLGVGF